MYLFQLNFSHVLFQILLQFSESLLYLLSFVYIKLHFLYFPFPSTHRIHGLNLTFIIPISLLFLLIFFYLYILRKPLVLNQLVLYFICFLFLFLHLLIKISMLVLRLLQHLRSCINALVLYREAHELCGLPPCA